MENDKKEIQKIEKRKKVVEVLTTCARFLPFALIVAVLASSLQYLDFAKISVSEIVELIIMVVFAAAIFVLSYFKIPKIKMIVGSVLFTTSAPIMFYVQEKFIHDPFNGSPIVKSQLIWINIVLLLMILIPLAILFARLSVATIVLSVICGGMGFANYLAVSFRGIPIYPWDFFSVGTAALVVDNYSITFTFELLFLISVVLFYVFASIFCDFKIKLGKWWIRTIICVMLSVGCIFVCGWFRTDKAINKYGYYPYLFSEAYLYKNNGTPLTLVFTSRYLTVDKPEDYKISDVSDVADEYESDSVQDATQKPNVIVIMNEAFSDPSVLGHEFTTNQDFLPFIHSLSGSNVKVGYTYSSVKGGNTPNSEYEFLTGMTMAFLPNGSIPYQQFVKDSFPNLVTQMSDLGYKTIGMHAYSSTGWKRNTVYPILGFDESIFSKDFKNISRIRSYISDRTMYENILDILDESTEPLFLFGVTMQNHGGYTSNETGFQMDISLDYIKSTALQTYLSLMKDSDEAFEYLINYIEDYVTEPTVVLMFGDHQPADSVLSSIYKLNGININEYMYESIEKYEERYITPYIMWANYDIDMSDLPEQMSINYLSSFMMSKIGLPLTGYQQWLLELYEDYPIINAGCIATSGQDGLNFQTVSSVNTDIISLYSKIQYNYIFGKKSRVNSFFSLVKKNQ